MKIGLMEKGHYRTETDKLNKGYVPKTFIYLLIFHVNVLFKFKHPPNLFF